MIVYTLHLQLLSLVCAVTVVLSYQSYNAYPRSAHANYESNYGNNYRAAMANEYAGDELVSTEQQTEMEQMPASRNNRYGIMKYQQQQHQQQQQQEPQMLSHDNQGSNVRMAKLNRETVNKQQQLNQNYARLKSKQGNMRSLKPDVRQNKCQIWVPTESMEKYKWYSRIQVDQSRRLELIEVCCSGYAPLLWGGSTTCQPVCDNCQNGYCIEPNVCQCYAEFVSNDNGDCVFSCPLGCQNGRCYLDGSCQCDAGYKLDENRKYCRPICSNGCASNPKHNCTAPEVCGCAKGYQLTDEGCQPMCTPDCGPGGMCNEDNECECKEGYNLKDGVCQANCYQKCDNGVCYSNNRCICNEGFTYHERSTLCVPK